MRNELKVMNSQQSDFDFLDRSPADNFDTMPPGIRRACEADHNPCRR